VNNFYAKTNRKTIKLKINTAEKLQGLGWKFVEASQLKRESAREPLFN